jgi:hypothetical protein
MCQTSAAFDPYYKWLAIPPDQQPTDYYRLLGVRRFETDSEVIATAADRQMAHVRTYQLGPHATECQTLLNELATARIRLLNPARRAAYDANLHIAKRRLAPARLAVPSPKPLQAPSPEPPTAELIAAPAQKPILMKHAWRPARRKRRRRMIGSAANLLAPIVGLAIGYAVLCATGNQAAVRELVFGPARAEEPASKGTSFPAHKDQPIGQSLDSALPAKPSSTVKKPMPNAVDQDSGHDSRSRWLNERFGTTVYHVQDKQWAESDNKTKELKWYLTEIDRGPDYVELFNPARNRTSRITGQRMLLKVGTQWRRLSNGHWDTGELRRPVEPPDNYARNVVD